MASFAFLSDLVRSRAGLVLGGEKFYLLETRLAPLLREEGLRDLGALVRRLAEHPGSELQQRVIERMATNETLFFRDGKPFEHLRSTGIPSLLQSRASGSTLRIWSAATSTGQEAYSIAMTVVESGFSERHRIEIVGTDLARDSIARAQMGRYTQYEVQRGLRTQQLIHHFTRAGNLWCIKPDFVALCEFRVWNLLDDLTNLGTFDIIFCRNVLMYFDPPSRRKVLSAIRQRLAPDGQLYLGLAEVTEEVTEYFQRGQDGSAVFRPSTQPVS